MSKGIRNLVSRKKRRFKEDGFDLDLSYITERLIAMGFPAQKFEGVYRNHIDEVCRFLEDRHKDHYRIYNLCSEKNRSYDEARFHNRVRNFPFADHNPPPLIDIEPLCKDMGDWLTEDQKNVAVVHCKAGKGRTGVMICCYLLHCRLKILAQEALDFYGDKRTFDRKGVTIPSQRRYVHYYGQLVSTNFNYNPPYVRLREAKMNAPLSSVNSEVYLVISSHLNKKGYSSESGDIRKGKEWIHLPVKDEVSRPMSGDIKIELKRTNFVRRTEKLFSAWLNTHFIFEEGKKVTNGCDINASDQNNHNTPNIRQRSNSFRVAKNDSFVRKRCETTAEPRAPPTGLGGGSSGGAGGSEEYYRETRKKKLSQSGSKSLPTTTTGHLTCLTDDGWGSSIDGPRSPRHTRCHTRHRRRHHTQNLPMCGTARDSWDSEARAGEQEVQVILTKNELDKASKDTHNKLLPEDFRIELWWLVTYVNKGGSNAMESRESGSTPSTITPSGSSSDEDEDEDDDEEEEGSDWDSAEGSEVLL